jgi:flagellar biosynthesis/type III secretory pathway protein FliH
MTNNKQQTAVEWLSEKVLHREWELLTQEKKRKILEQAREMEIAGKEMSYADGYKEGYKRALEMVEWYIKNYIGGMVQDHIGDINKKVDE